MAAQHNTRLTFGLIAHGSQGIQSDDVMAEAAAFWQSALAKENEAIAAGIKAAADGSRPATAPTSTGLISIKVCNIWHARL
jgi:hypothetical protein